MIVAVFLSSAIDTTSGSSGDSDEESEELSEELSEEVSEEESEEESDEDSEEDSDEESEELSEDAPDEESEATGVSEEELSLPPHAAIPKTAVVAQRQASKERMPFFFIF